MEKKKLATLSGKFIPIVSLDAVWDGFKNSCSENDKEKDYSLESARKDMDCQIKVIKWMLEKIEAININLPYFDFFPEQNRCIQGDSPTIAPFMNLNELAQAVAWANGYGKVLASSSTGQQRIIPFMAEADIYNTKLDLPNSKKDEMLSQYPSFSKKIRNIDGLNEKFLVGYVPGPLTLLEQIIGQAKLFLLIAKNRQQYRSKKKEDEKLTFEEILNGWLNYANKVVKNYSEYLINEGKFEIIFILEPSVIYLEHEDFMKILHKNIEDLIKTIKENGAFSVFHACGDTSKLIRAFAMIKGLDAIQVDEEVSVKSLAKVLEIKGNKSTMILGNSDNKRLDFYEEKTIFRDSVLNGLEKWKLSKKKLCTGPACEITSFGDNRKIISKCTALLVGSNPNVIDIVINFIDDLWDQIVADNKLELSNEDRK